MMLVPLSILFLLYDIVFFFSHENGLNGEALDELCISLSVWQGDQMFLYLLICYMIVEAFPSC